MAVVRVVVRVFCDVREMRQIVGILTRTIYISNFMLTYRSLRIVEFSSNKLFIITNAVLLLIWVEL